MSASIPCSGIRISEDVENNNLAEESSNSRQGDPSNPSSLTGEFMEDHIPELTMLQEEYVDPSVDYVFVNNRYSQLDNSDNLMKQLVELGVRVDSDYLTLDLDMGPRSGSFNTDSEDEDSLEQDIEKLLSEKHDDELFDSICGNVTELPEYEVAEAEILPNGSVKVTYENFQRPYTAKVSSSENFHKYLQLVDGTSNAIGPSKISSDASNSNFSSNTKIYLLKQKFLQRIHKMKQPLTEVQEKCVAKLRQFGDLAYDATTPDSGVHEGIVTTPQEDEKLKADLKQELAKTEDEIQTLRQVLASKVKHAQEIKRKLGITVWTEFSEDISTSLKSVKQSETVQKANEVLNEFHGAVTSAPLYQSASTKMSEFRESVSNSLVYQKTAGAVSAVGEKTGAIFGGIGAKFGQLKETPTFKSFEERVGSVYTTARSKVTGTESNSTHDFEEALREAEAEKQANEAANATESAPATTS